MWKDRDSYQRLSELASASSSREMRPCVRATTVVDVPPGVPVEEVSLERLVVVREGALTTAGVPCRTDPSCTHSATMDELYGGLDDAKRGAYEQVVSALAHGPRRHEDREIRPIAIDRLPVLDYRDALRDPAAVEFARLTLGNGDGSEPWWQAAKTQGCGGILLPRERSLILFVFRAAFRRHVELADPVLTLTEEEILAQEQSRGSVT